MLYIFRLIITVIYSILVCVFGSIYCLFSPRNPKHVATFGHMFGRLAPLFGLKVECRKPADAENYGNAIYIANHQNNYDMVTASNIVQPPTVTVGKKSLLWIPFFGQLYWLTGNLLIDRNNRTKAHGTIAEVVNHFKNAVFPSGCSRKEPAAVVAACCRSRPGHFTRQLRRASRLYPCASLQLRIRLILIGYTTVW